MLHKYILFIRLKYKDKFHRNDHKREHCLEYLGWNISIIIALNIQID